MFSGLSKLQDIILSLNNLQYVHPDTFLRSPNIKSVILYGNPDLIIPTERNFINSRSLLKLDISHCTVSSLSVKTFSNVSAMELLDLEDNSLMTVDINILKALPKLSELRLYDNPLQCDCQLLEMLRWGQDRNIDMGIGECETSGGVTLWWERQPEGCRILKNNIQDYVDCRSTNYSYTDIKYTLTVTNTDSETECDTDSATESDTDSATESDTDSATESDTDTEQNGGDSNFLTQYQLPIYAVSFIFVTICYVILFFIISCNKDMKNVFNVFFLNLATSNIIYLMVLFFEACANTISTTWLEDEFKCIYISFCRSLSVGLSAYSVAVLSIQQYRVTVNPSSDHLSSRAKRCVTVATVFGVWIVAAVFAFPSAISKYVCFDFLLFPNISYYKHVVIFEFLVYYVIPLCVIIITCIMTARHLVESSRRLSEGTQNHQLNTENPQLNTENPQLNTENPQLNTENPQLNTENPQLNTENPQQNTGRNTTKGLIFVFLLSNVLYHVIWICHVFKEEKLFYLKTYDLSIYTDRPDNALHHSNYNLQFMYLISTSFLLLNSCLNPVVLLCTSSPFRQHLKRYLTCLRKTTSPQNNLELGRMS
jgi:hypothetical protein